MKNTGVYSIAQKPHRNQAGELFADLATIELPDAWDSERPLPAINLAIESGERERQKVRPAPVSTSTTAAIEAIPHLSQQITRLWHSRDLNTLIHKLLLDSRDGGRRGFPHEVAKELMFLAKMNVIVRASAAAPLLGTSLAEACRLIEKGDHAALGHTSPPPDIWGAGERARLVAAPRLPPAAHVAPPRHLAKAAKTARPAPEALSPRLNEAPALPPSVCLDLTTAKTLRHDRSADRPDEGDLMDRGFFRCIAKELGNLKIPQLVLSDLGNARRCPWLPSAISFAKTRCHFPKVVLHIDPLSAPEPLLVLAMAAGLDHLVINFNLASGKWRSRAEVLLESNADYFNRQLRRLIASRNELTAKSGHHCLISVIQINHKTLYHLSQTFAQVSLEPGLVRFQHIVETVRREASGTCHCWSPFIEAHIRTNGHLVACAQDHSGYSFLANLKETTFTEAWHGQLFRSTRQRVLKGDKPGKFCEICPYLVLSKTPAAPPGPPEPRVEPPPAGGLAKSGHPVSTSTPQRLQNDAPHLIG
ncbi:MAG: molybdenum cofactor biosynthesis protein [Proteobacteria bacterium]|nr:molybdenum cofactor biosynthesis protein [Pseudomonadota bacterium]